MNGKCSRILVLSLIIIGLLNFSSISLAADLDGRGSTEAGSSSVLTRDHAIAVHVNGQAVRSEHAGYLRSDGILYVSVRGLAEGLGMKTEWKPKKNFAIVTTSNEQTFYFSPNKENFWFNGQRYDLEFGTESEVDAGTSGDYVMIPAFAASKLFKAEVKWDAQTKQLNISKKDGNVLAGSGSSFLREWDVWSPEPSESLELAKALFKNAKIADGKLTVTVPELRDKRNGFIVFKGTNETPLQKGKTYTYRIGDTKAGNLYAYRTDPKGGILEEYWIWLSPGTLKYTYGIYGRQEAPVLIQNKRGKIVSLERMKKVIADAGKMLDCGIVDFKSGDSVVQLPMYCAAARYGADEPGHTPRIRPKSPLPAINFDIPRGQETRLAAYWMNQNAADGETGMLFIAPRGWKVDTAEVGANGSTGVRLIDPRDPKRHLRISTIPGCQGCAISAIGTYFSDLRQWAEDQTFPGSDIPFLAQRKIDANTVAYAKPISEQGYAANGIAYQRHSQEGGVFGSAELQLDNVSPDLVDTILKFLAAQLPSWV
ncbi:DUF4850 domain-containing protein [Cohnella terricola]|uniref:DUF4850 domain-containing protein n=1 Tax=Cohnella terricola TaxID=1289167 RepID=UPI001643FFAC|nr:DUF4850 domain-containing protein [Cohnella terricola]